MLFTIALTAYFALHSILAARRIKGVIVKYLMPVRYYRLFYNLFSIFSMLPLAWWFLALDKTALLKSTWYLLPGILLILAGVLWILRAMRGYNLGEFSGLYQLRYGGQPHNVELITTGLNASVRHPLYFGTLQVFWGTFLLYPTDVSLIVAALSSAYLVIGSKLEERKLAQQFGGAYRSYQRKVPMLVPFRWGRKKN